MNWILIVAFATSMTSGTGYTFQTFETEQACKKAEEWVKANNVRRGPLKTVCMSKQ